MSANEKRRKRAVSTWHNAGEVFEINSIAVIWEGKRFAAIRFTSDLSEATTKPSFGIIVSFGADHTTSRLAEFANVSF